MHLYNVRDVERVLQLPRSTLQSLIKIGFVRPARGPRREYLFSFQDLIVLRTARALIEANVPRKRIRRSLESLRRHLPETMPLSGLSICAVGDRVVVRDGTRHWQADDGQYLLGLDVTLQNGVLHVVEHQDQPPAARETHAKNAAEWFAEALELESTNPPEALRAYQRSVEADPDNLGAWINRGRLLHEQGDTRQAERVYRSAIEHCGTDALLMFNLGVLMEDLGKPDAALEAYHTAINEDPNLADCHYNLARLYESQGKSQHAIRHLGQYRRLLTHEH
ncbi:MAG TPA: tetratricopeptide repeat protein [Steroidobacteraceae bacterium]|nr:tetratricopeptide repeat protein [Steroidobacteraceae bacterium]